MVMMMVMMIGRLIEVIIAFFSFIVVIILVPTHHHVYISAVVRQLAHVHSFSSVCSLLFKVHFTFVPVCLAMTV